MRRLNKLFFIALLALPAATIAKTSDAEKPINIEADQVEIRERESLSIYRGNVRITQGSLRINGDVIQFSSTEEGHQKVIILGKPASFFQLTDQNQEISAQGEEMEYHAKTGLFTLERNAVLVQQDNRFTSEHIVYNTQTNVVKAGVPNNTSSSTSTKPPRVTITVMPAVMPTVTPPAPKADANIVQETKPEKQ